MLEATAGGADARPFVTFHNALQQPFVLRIATGARPPDTLLRPMRTALIEAVCYFWANKP